MTLLKTIAPTDMSEVYLFNLVDGWLKAKATYNETKDAQDLGHVAWFEMSIEQLVNQIKRERLARSNPSY